MSKNTNQLGQKGEDTQKVFTYEWKDRVNKRNYFVRVAEKGRLVGFICTNSSDIVIYHLDFEREKRVAGKQQWYLPAGPLVPSDLMGPSEISDRPVIFGDQFSYDLCLLKPASEKAEEIEASQLLISTSPLPKTKIFCYEFADKHNRRAYEVWFHEDGGLEGYRSYEGAETKEADNILHEVPAQVAADAYIWEEMKMVGEFEIVKAEKEEEGKTKIFWYEIFDERNERSYRLGFHEDGDMVSFRSYESTDTIVHENYRLEDPAWFVCQNLRMVGKFELLSVESYD